MKRLSLLVVLCTIVSSCYSQFYIGSKEAQVRQQIEQDYGAVNIEKTYNNDNTYSLMWVIPQTGGYGVTFGVYGLGFQFMFVPKDEQVLNLTIEQFNKKFVTASNNIWKVYRNGRTYKVELIWSDRYSTYAFFFTLTN